MRRPFGHLGLILGSASLLFGCPGGDDSSGDGSTGGPTTDPTMSTTMSTTTPATDTVDPSDTGSESGSSGSGSESGSGSGSDSGSDSGSGSGSSSSGSASAAGDLVISFTGYAPHNGQDVYLKVFTEDDTELGEATAVAANEFEITVSGVIEEGENYTVRWWVDFNDSGACEEADHRWEIADQPGTADGLALSHAHDINFADVCSFWKK